MLDVIYSFDALCLIIADAVVVVKIRRQTPALDIGIAVDSAADDGAAMLPVKSWKICPPSEKGNTVWRAGDDHRAYLLVSLRLKKPAGKEK